MSTDDVLKRTKRIETLLGKLGGVGRGLHEKLTSVQDRLDDAALKRGRFLASVRNKLLHEDGYTLTDHTFARFITAADNLESHITTLLEPKPAPRAAASYARSPGAQTQNQEGFSKTELGVLGVGAIAFVAWKIYRFLR